MKKFLIALAVLAMTACSSKGTPTAPSLDAANLTAPVPLTQNTVIWGTSNGGMKLYYRLDIDTGSLGNPSPLGSDVSATISAVNGIPTKNVNFNVNYGTVVNGPQTVTILAFEQSVRFTVHTTGTGTDAHVGVPSQNTNVPAHVSTNTVIWGT